MGKEVLAQGKDAGTASGNCCKQGEMSKKEDRKTLSKNLKKVYDTIY